MPPHLPLTESSFPAVLDGLRRGDATSVECVFVDLQPRLLRFLRTSEPKAADDIAGDVWLAISQGVGRFEGDLNGFRAWVFTIARRRLADHRRLAGRRATDPVDHELFERTEGAGDPADMVLTDLSAQESVDLITAHLSPDQAEVLLLRVLGGLDVAQVAEVMDRTPNWVRVMQHRGLRRLAFALAPEESSGGAVIPIDSGRI